MAQILNYPVAEWLIGGNHYMIVGRLWKSTSCDLYWRKDPPTTYLVSAKRVSVHALEIV